ncbi:hypothetical protein K503DRAFT_236882 [Rhizopogon vinicolor AM-OR11-026]|uniref:Uncharacterized protein n=1 Tax=Rhizopogon vinicolor AM-OR11-026 TaxID=1314800 RepID=A0A1B7MXT6_9AGAM|nr:hypothetical protein K503DRAFT_236882 [Rhizopogon vinicolor AM-OR11-026]
MSSEYPSHLHLQPNGTSFKRTFEQFGYDSGSSMTSALQATGSAAGNHHVPPGSSSNNGGNERNKRARSTSSSSLSDRSADSSRSSEYNTARSSASLSESSTNDQNLTLDQNTRSIDYSVPLIASPSSTCTLATPAPVLPSTEHQDEDMSDSSGFSLDIPRPTPLPAVPSTTHDVLRNSLERFNEFDSHIAALRRSHSRTPSWIRTASPAQSPHPSSNTTTETFENWDWTHFGDSPASSHTAGEDPRHQFSTDSTGSVGSGGTYTAVPRQGDSLSFPASDGVSRPGYAASSSNTSSSTSSLTIPPHPSYHLSSPTSSSSRANPFNRESNEFPNDLTGSPDSAASVSQIERNDTDVLDGLDGSVFMPPTSDLPTTTQTTRRSTHSGIGPRTMSSARTSATTSTASSVFAGPLSHFYGTSEERHRGTSNTFEVDSDPPPSLSAGRYEERPARARTLIGHSRTSSMMFVFFICYCLRIVLGRPFSEAFASFDRAQTAQDSGETEASLDPFFAEHSTDHGFNERRRRMVARNRYSITSEDDDDDDDASHPERVHEIIEGLHNARGLLERGVETARSLSGAPSRPEPSPPPPRYRFHSRLYASATTVSSNSLVSESAAEHRRTNARAQLRSQMFNSRPSSDEPPRDTSELSTLTAAARLRRLIANQTDSSPSSNTPSGPPSSGRTSEPSSRPFGYNGSGTPSQLPRGGLDDRERVRFAEILSDRRHPQARSGDDRSPSRDHNHSEDSLDNIFDPVFAPIDTLPDFASSVEEDAQPPYGYRPPTPPLHSVRARSRSPPRLSWERPQASTGDSSARSHPFNNVNLDVFPPGVYRDSLRRSIQASQTRIPRIPEPAPSYEPPTFSLGNSDEDNDSDDMESYFGIPPRRGRREHTAATSARLAPRRMMPEPAVSTTSLAFGVDAHDTSLPSNNAFAGSRGRILPLRGQQSDEHLARHRLNEPGRGLPSSPLDSFWSSDRRDAPTHNPRPPSWSQDVSEARDRMRAIRDLMDRYGTDSERSDLASRRDIPPPHQEPPGRPGNLNRHVSLPWRSSLIQSHGSSTGSGSPSNSRSSSSSSSDLNPYRNIADRPRERQEPTPQEERTPIRTLRQRAALIRGAPRTDGTRIRSMFRTMARRNMGDYMVCVMYYVY